MPIVVIKGKGGLTASTYDTMALTQGLQDDPKRRKDQRQRGGKAEEKRTQRREGEGEEVVAIIKRDRVSLQSQGTTDQRDTVRTDPFTELYIGPLIPSGCRWGLSSSLFVSWASAIYVQSICRAPDHRW